jgi:demethylmenaquinone methyltransferase/2-methoxy-6-polyprenyl-1,4-benzoquinol methylase
LAELKRVLKPKGVLAILEFSQPTVPGIRAFVRIYYSRLLPSIGGWFSGSRSAYEYLPNRLGSFRTRKLWLA